MYMCVRVCLCENLESKILYPGTENVFAICIAESGNAGTALSSIF